MSGQERSGSHGKAILDTALNQFCLAAGGMCAKSPSSRDVVDNGDDTCVYCGARATGPGYCAKSPTHTHMPGGGMIID